MTKRIAALITLIAMLLTLCATAFAAKQLRLADDEEIRGEFVYKKGTNIILAYTGEGGVCEIPEDTVVKNLHSAGASRGTITKLIIGKGAVVSADGISGLREIEYMEGVTEIPNHAFSYCKNVEKITFPSTLKTIGDYAFRECNSLKSVTFPDSLERIGEYAFYECSRLKSITFNDGLKYIGSNSFSYLPSLTGDIIIPDTVTELGGKTFEECGKLNRVHLSDNLSAPYLWFSRTQINEINIPNSLLDNPPTVYADEITFNSDMTLKICNAVRYSAWCENKYFQGKTDKTTGPYKDFIVLEDTLVRYTGTDRNPTVPDGVKVIDEGAFCFCDVDSVILPESLEEIKEWSFGYCTLKSIVIPENVKKIGDGVFQDCYLLSSLTFKGEPVLGQNAVVISDVLTEDNIICEKQSDKLLEKIYLSGIASDTEDALPGFYMTINDNREAMGLDPIPVPEEYREIDPNTGGKVRATPKPQTTAEPKPTTAPQSTAAPEETARPAATETPKETPAPQILSVHGGDTIDVSVSGSRVTFPDAQPFIDDSSRTQIPIRAVADMLNCEVDWDKNTRTVTITRDNGGIVTLTIDSSIISVNDNAIQMDTSAIIKDDRTYIPIRFVAEAMGLKVEWEK